MNFEELKNIKKVIIFIENEKIEGELIEINKWGKMIISVPPRTKIIPVELGKRGEVFFEKDNKKYFVSGKIFSQGVERVVVLPETDILNERRKNERLETDFIPVKLVGKISLFHKEEINGNILNISLSGAKVETSMPLKEGVFYDFQTTFFIKKKPYSFSAKCKLKFMKKIRNLYLNGVEFIEIDPLSFEILNKYIKELKHELGKDTLNY
ncbi:MAG: PilZ domain-containing protein [Candidatus Omnitrophica bacterium]|nr:PilZ domain-containing protein [Candidatus Omnitrophota bacterium]